MLTQCWSFTLESEVQVGESQSFSLLLPSAPKPPSLRGSTDKQRKQIPI